MMRARKNILEQPVLLPATFKWLQKQQNQDFKSSTLSTLYKSDETNLKTYLMSLGEMAEVAVRDGTNLLIVSNRAKKHGCRYPRCSL